MSVHATEQGAAPAELTAGHIRRRLLVLAMIAAAATLVIAVGPGLTSLRHRFDHAAPGWLVAGLALELLSALAYVVLLRAVFSQRMSWRTSYEIGMAEQAANALLPASGAGGLALGAWALRRNGMDAKRIARRSVAFFLLTSLANVGAVIVFAGLYGVGILHHDRNATLTYGFGAASLAVLVAVLALPRLISPAADDASPAAHDAPPARPAGRVRTAARLVRGSLGDGIGDSLRLLRGRGAAAVLAGSMGTMAFDLATLGVCFRAFNAKPAIGVLVLGYLIGQLGGNLPVPGGIGGVDGGLIGTFALYHAPLASTAAAVIAYRTISLWLPLAPGGLAFLQLRRRFTRAAAGRSNGAPCRRPPCTILEPAA
jgi:uncharacterized membrane protein YbhN (UPF0104 family)